MVWQGNIFDTIIHGISQIVKANVAHKYKDAR